MTKTIKPVERLSACCKAKFHDHCNHYHMGANDCPVWCSKCYRQMSAVLDDEGHSKPYKTVTKKVIDDGPYD